MFPGVSLLSPGSQQKADLGEVSRIAVHFGGEYTCLLFPGALESSKSPSSCDSGSLYRLSQPDHCSGHALHRPARPGSSYPCAWSAVAPGMWPLWGAGWDVRCKSWGTQFPLTPWAQRSVSGLKKKVTFSDSGRGCGYSSGCIKFCGGIVCHFYLPVL